MFRKPHNEDQNDSNIMMSHHNVTIILVPFVFETIFYLEIISF